MEKKGLTAPVTGRTDINYHLLLPPTKYLELEKARTHEKWGLEPELLGGHLILLRFIKKCSNFDLSTI